MKSKSPALQNSIFLFKSTCSMNLSIVLITVKFSSLQVILKIFLIFSLKSLRLFRSVNYENIYTFDEKLKSISEN